MNLGPLVYALVLCGGVLASALYWKRVATRRPLLLAAYLGGLFGAFLGARVAFVLAELPWLLRDPQGLRNALYGKTVLGGLLGGYAGVELGKWLTKQREATGDVFAAIVPLGLAAGRLGCTVHGCCPGVAVEHARWYTPRDEAGVPRVPATLVELGFHLASAVLLRHLARRGALRGQLFHAYLLAYGLFRAASEGWRATPRYAAVPWLSPYQVLALGLAAFAAWRAYARWRSPVSVVALAGGVALDEPAAQAPHNGAVA